MCYWLSDITHGVIRFAYVVCRPTGISYALFGMQQLAYGDGIGHLSFSMGHCLDSRGSYPRKMIASMALPVLVQEENRSPHAYDL